MHKWDGQGYLQAHNIPELKISLFEKNDRLPASLGIKREPS